MSLRCFRRAARNFSTSASSSLFFSNFRSMSVLQTSKPPESKDFSALDLASQISEKHLCAYDKGEGSKESGAGLASVSASRSTDPQDGVLKASEPRQDGQQEGSNSLHLPGGIAQGSEGPKPRKGSKAKDTVPVLGEGETPRKKRRADYGKKGFKYRQKLEKQKQLEIPENLPDHVKEHMWRVVAEPNIRVDASQTRIHQARDRIKADVQFAVQRQFGTSYHVEYFGSIRYGVSHAHSDLDMVIIDPKYPQGLIKKDFSEPLYKPNAIAIAMKRGGFIDVESRPRSAVPIARFKDKYTGLECDLNVNERLGVVNSDLIKEYCDNSNVLRPLLFSIKEWAKPLRLNSPSPVGLAPSFSSYAFVLMTITFLQSKGLLPNLQEVTPLSGEERSKHMVWTRKPHRGWDARFSKLENYIPLGEPDVESLLREWFQFWAAFPYAKQCASIRHGAFLPRKSPLIAEFQEMKVPTAVCVLDPFILTKNVTTNISKKVLQRFRKECRKALGSAEEEPSSEES